MDTHVSISFVAQDGRHVVTSPLSLAQMSVKSDAELIAWLEEMISREAFSTTIQLEHEAP